jgi:hypothetical protein
MRHDRHADLLRDLQRHLERHVAELVAGAAPDPDLDAEDQVAVLLRHARAFARIEQSQVGGLADHDLLREGVDAGIGQVQVRQDAHGRGLDHVRAEAVEVAGPGAARVDEGRDRAAAR